MGLTISRRNDNKPCFVSAIPNDLLNTIVSRLPVEDAARCRCVSKQWASVLSRRLTTSSTSPRILFTFQQNGKWVFFSAPQPQNPNQNSYLLTPEYHTCLPTGGVIRPPVYGLMICCKDKNVVICNPSTGEYKTLPDLMTCMEAGMRTFFGYDPVGKQYKVLCMQVFKDTYIQKAMVLTLGTRIWRKIDECSRPYEPIGFGICISGVLYYIAHRITYRDFMIVCFVLSSENLDYIIPPPMEELRSMTPIDYKGKLGVLASRSISGTAESIELWVLDDDAEEGRWSRHIYIFPPTWKDLVAPRTIYTVVGMTRNSEIVFFSHYPSDPFYLLSYNVEKNTVIKVLIQGLPSRTSWILTYVDHIENVNNL